ncbi:hypothetical protein LCGC14_0328090 [marine sediment metagenome]|uniref:Uncharacterized protein n=1 Tax=marine sediment metagenome TaxID=412755 RepID=A0A0F9TH83_9ZZZZ
MKIENSLSTEHLNLLVLAAGVFASVVCWNLISGRTAELQYEPVYGEVNASPIEGSISEKFKDLPLVEAKTDVEAVEVTQLNDMLIEAAFREPVFSVPAEVAQERLQSETDNKNLSQSQVATTSQLFLLNYRPLIGGVNKLGAVVNGDFWGWGKSITTMPIRDTQTEEILFPKLKGLSGNNVILSVANDDLSVEFERF